MQRCAAIKHDNQKAFPPVFLDGPAGVLLSDTPRIRLPGLGGWTLDRTRPQTADRLGTLTEGAHDSPVTANIRPRPSAAHPEIRRSYARAETWRSRLGKNAGDEPSDSPETSKKGRKIVAVHGAERILGTVKPC